MSALQRLLGSANSKIISSGNRIWSRPCDRTIKSYGTQQRIHVERNSSLSSKDEKYGKVTISAYLER